MDPRIYSALLVALCLTTQSHAQGTLQPLTITFDGPPVLALGSAIGVQSYYESGLVFQPIGLSGPGNLFTRVASGGPAFQAENGSAYIRTGLGQSLMVYSLNGSPFDLRFVDLAEYSTVAPNAVTLHFIGYHADGSTVTADLITDGIIDGTGPLADFQTFPFDAKAWRNLIRVEIPTYGWSLDNLSVSVGVPEPSATTLLLFGVAGIWLFPRRRNRTRRF